MRPSAARLIVFGAAGSARRLAGIAAGVALGSAMLLILLGAYMHMPDRDNRIAWHESQGPWRDYTEAGDLIPIEESASTVLVSTSHGFVKDTNYEVVRVASTPDTTVAFPEGLAAPAAGEYYASPELAELIDSLPSDELGDRFGTRLGILPDSMLKGPDQKIALVGADWELLNSSPNARAQEAFPADGDKAMSVTFRIIIGVGSVAMLVPITLLIAIVAQLGAAERRERYATIRLIGAGRRTMANLAALEMAVASFIGAVAGVGLAALLRPAAQLMPVNGTRSFGADLTPSLGWTIAAVVGLTVLAGASAGWRTYRDDDGALGAARERAEKPATAWRVIPLALGLGMFSLSAVSVAKGFGSAELAVFGLMGGFALTAFGIVHAGAWLTKVASTAFAKAARSASSLVAAGRLARHPRATFRSVAGVVVAVFVVSMLAGVISSVQGITKAGDGPGLLPRAAVLAAVEEQSDAEAMADAAAGVQGVTSVVVAYDDGSGNEIVTKEEAERLGLTDLPESQWIAVDMYGMLAGDYLGLEDAMTEPTAATAPSGGATYVVALTDGSDGAIERARTALEVEGQLQDPAITRPNYLGGAALDITYQLAMLAYIGMAIAVGISALALTVATVAAALDRKRTFGLLRLGGMPVSELRRVISIEAALPLAVTLVASAGLGYGLAWVTIVTLGNGLFLTWPDPLYWWAMLGSAAVALVAVSGSFGVVRRSTEIASTRFE